MPRPDALSVISIILTLFVSPPATAQIVAYWGQVEAVHLDTGTGKYSGGVPNPNDFFYAYYLLQTACEADCQAEVISPNETHYHFDNLGESAIRADWVGSCDIDRSSVTTIEIANDRPADQSMVDLTAALGLTVGLGQPLDVISLTSGTIIPGLQKAVQWSVRLVFATQDPLDDMLLQPIPYIERDLELFELVETEPGSGEVYSAIGTGLVPEPSAVSLLATGCLALALRVSRRENRESKRPGPRFRTGATPSEL